MGRIRRFLLIKDGDTVRALLRMTLINARYAVLEALMVGKESGSFGRRPLT